MPTFACMAQVGVSMVLLGLVACAGPSVRSLPVSSAVRPPVASEAPERAPLRVAKRATDAAADFGSLFVADDGDLEIANVGATAIHKRHVYDRLLEVDPVRLREIEEALVLDARVREVARALDVHVRDDDVEFAVRREWARVTRLYEKQPLGTSTIEEYVEKSYSMSSENFRAHLKLLAWRRLTRSYVIRYAHLRSGTLRLQRFLARSREDAQRAHTECSRGGDLARLAESASVDSRARVGGRLPLLPIEGRHPSVLLADGVSVGALGPVRVTVLEDGSEGFGFVRVLERRDPDPRSFAEAYGDLRKELERRPIARDEILAFLAS